MSPPNGTRTLRQQLLWFRELPRGYWPVWTATLVNQLGTFVAPFLVLYLTSTGDFSTSVAGAVAGVFLASSIAAQPLGGRLADRYGPKLVVVVGLTTSGLSTLALGATSGLVPLVVLCAVAGLTSSLYRPALQALVVTSVDSGLIRQAFGAQFWAVNLGFAAGSAAAGLLVANSYFLLFAVDASTCLAAAAVVAVSIPGVERNRPLVDRNRSGVARRPAFLTPLMPPVLALVFTYSLLYGQVMVSVPLAIRQHLGSVVVYGLMLTLNGLLIVICQPFAVAWLSGITRARMLLVAYLLLGTGLAIALIGHTEITVFGGVTIWTLGEIASGGLLGTIVAELAPPALRGRYMGAFGMSSALGTALAAPLGGWLWHATGSSTLALGALTLSVIGGTGHLLLGRKLRERMAESDPLATTART